MEDVSTPTNEPTTTPDVANTGDVLTQLVTDQFNKHGSDGEQVSTEPATTADVTGQPASGTQAPDDMGTVTRINQELASIKKALRALGIDPDGDVLDKLNAGLITKEELLQAKPEAPPEEKRFSMEEFSSFNKSCKERVNAGERITEADFVKGMDFMQSVAQNTQQLSASREQERVNALINNCIGATTQVIRSDELHNSLPENIRPIEEKFFTAATDVILGEATGGNPNKMTPDNYGTYAQQNLKGDFEKLRNAWIEYGRSQNRPQAPPPGINPISVNEGGGPMKPPTTMINLENMAQAAQNYIPGSPVI